MNTQQKRLQKELAAVISNPDDGVSIYPNEDDLCNWIAHIDGPKDSPYEGGIFKLNIHFPDRYPFEPPKIVFDTPIFHPNISIDGKVCVSIFREGWKASMTTQKALLSIQSLMVFPNTDDPLMVDIANLYKNDYDKYIRLAKKHTKKYAM